jgi:serine/threonine protein kinase
MERERLGKYELLERLGRGGMGEVWKARDTQLRRYVAIKLLHADLEANPDFVTHFMREAQLVASLRHPNIVQIHDFQLTNEQESSVKAYMVMDYIEGGTLADFIRDTVRRGLFPPAADLVNLFAAISLALDYAHEKGMVHRDIKPANILLDRTTNPSKAIGEPILTDFGIARLQGTTASTVTRAFVGTPLYISPEQAENRAVDRRSDLYSLGIVLYEILTGITPFRGDNPLAIMMQHVHEPPPPPALINHNIPPALSVVVVRSIAKDPLGRFPSATAMTVALAQAFNLPVPTSLSNPGERNRQQGSNPLQPMPGLTPHSAALAASSPAAFTPTSVNYPGAQNLTPTIYSQAPGVSGGMVRPGSWNPAAHTPVTGFYAPRQETMTQPPPARGALTQPARARQKWLWLACAACVLLLLVGIGAVSLRAGLFSQHATSTPTTVASTVIGQITFASSPGAPHGTFDQVRVDLTHVPSPPAGTTYYAWLEQSNSETVAIPHWQLSVVNGAVHAGYSNPQHINLLTSSKLFLITEEDASISPVIPIPASDRHLYYAPISASSAATPVFEVRPCPPANSAGNVCV